MASRIRRWIRRKVNSNNAKLGILVTLFGAIAFLTALLINEILAPLSHISMTLLEPEAPFIETHIAIIWLVALCAAIVSFSLLAIRVVRPRIHNFIFGSIGGSHARITYIIFLMAAVLVVITAGLSVDAKTKLLSHFVDHNGAWIAVFGLVLSIGGLHFSAIAMQDLRHVINTFEDFKDRLAAMLKEVSGDMDSTDYVRIMAYTPLPGSLALKVADYIHLRDAILDNKTRVEVTCLDADSVREWMQRFEGKRTRGGGKVGPLEIASAVTEIESLVTDLCSPRVSRQRAFATDHAVLRGTMIDLPHFYTYFTNNRALVINPIYFPIDTLSAADQPADLKARCVELIGFETTDTYTVRNLHNVYDVVRGYIENRG